MHGNFSYAGQWEAKYYQVESYIIHAHYYPKLLDGTGSHDIALIKLEDNVVVPERYRRFFPEPCDYRKSRSAVGIGNLLGLGKGCTIWYLKIHFYNALTKFWERVSPEFILRNAFEKLFKNMPEVLNSKNKGIKNVWESFRHFFFQKYQIRLNETAMNLTFPSLNSGDDAQSLKSKKIC